MSNPDHLYEADKIRIQNEAKVRTAMERPNFIKEQYEIWREETGTPIEGKTLTESLRGQAERAYARAWLAEGREIKMGREINKLQQRIARQRKANRELRHALQEAQAEAQVRQ